MINSLKEIRNLAKSKYNAKFTIIVWPSVKIDFKERLAMEKFDIIELPEYLEEEEYKIQYDDHPTAKTNEEIAKLLYEHIKKKIPKRLIMPAKQIRIAKSAGFCFGVKGR